MIKNPYSRKTITLFFLVIFFSNILPYNALYAQSSTPNAVEAAAFEPVDATDMVNLVTGNMSYVLPLLSVPSPEGGYPLALSYHAGIAMEQEASWVGLGWNLNPGAINRGVNGYPDDWGKTNVSEFFYDKGWENNYYSFSLGVTVSQYISVGVGLSWGSNQSLGGYVEANIGIKGSKASIGGRIGTNGASLQANYGMYRAHLSSSGVGVGFKAVSLNYNYSSGFSGEMSFGHDNGTYKSAINSMSMGVSFSSKGLSINSSMNGKGVGVSNSVESIDSGDYDSVVTETNFFLPIYIFYAGFNHTNIKYSLFKYNNLYTSGMLYPVKANRNQYYDYPNQDKLSRRLEENHFMDVNIVQPFYEDSLYDFLIEDANKNNRNNLMLPNYDNYSVNAQGLSGSITPYNFVDLNLSGRGRNKRNKDNEYISYLNYDIKEYEAPPSSVINNGADYNAIRKKHFTFVGAYNSFLRLKKSNISKISVHNASSDYLMKTYATEDTDKYRNYNSLNNITNKKREGNTIVTYTNKEIREGNIPGFIDAKEGYDKLNRNNKNIFLDEGVGAFKITVLDGKTYHYSLPVYQFESVYKNFKKVNGRGDDVATENDNFFEIQKNTPYATHWLLTGITGPDYVDTDNDGKFSNSDYGYWVEFDYGKWSDGYIWRTPNGRVEENIDSKKPNNNTYSYSWGRKQVYYLDAIKTRTHTALFVKDLRKDSRGISKTDYILKHDESKMFNLKKNAKSYHRNDVLDCGHMLLPWGDKYYNKTFYDYSNKPFKIKKETYGWYNNIHYTNEVFYKYIEVPESLSLRLKKIILLKNNVGINISKDRGNIIERSKGKLLQTKAYNKILRHVVGGANPGCFTMIDGLMLEKYNLKQFYIHQHKNIIDIKDIDGLNLESKATQVIEFQHDYSLANGAPNTSSGRLTLKKLYFKGKRGAQLIPPYEFSYQNAHNSYNKDDIDAWGYHKTKPAIWSLQNIKTPTGGNIKIDHEPDIYSVGAAYSEEVKFSEISSITNSGTIFRINFNTGSLPTNSYFTKGLYYKFTCTEEKTQEGHYPEDIFTEINNIEERYKVVNVGNNWIEVETESTSTYLRDYNSIDNCDNVGGIERHCISDFTFYGNANGQSTSNIGGGIRTKSITINNGIKDIATTQYNYKDGITSYAPSKEQIGVPYRSELPAPMVLYGEVEMETKDGNGKYLEKTIYNFETLKPRQQEDGYIFSLGECFRVKENQSATFENGKVIANKYTIESRLGNIGRINSIRSYNNVGQLLSQTKNKYKKNLDTDGEIGVTQETHSSYKRLFKNNNEKFYVSSTSKINYPSVLESVEQTSGGLTVTKHFDKHDFLTGQLLETRTYTSDGKAFKTKIVPAYKRYTQMGSKVDDPNNKNMLLQIATQYSYLFKNDEWKPISAGITTWNNQWTYLFDGGSGHDSNDTWRKHKTFVWKGDTDTNGIYVDFNDTNDDNFQWGVGDAQTNSKWQEVSETTIYDHYSSPLEIKDINGNLASTKKGDNFSKVIASANAAYNEMFYSGVENLGAFSAALPTQAGVVLTDFDNGGNAADRKWTTVKAHTGLFSLSVDTSVDHFQAKLKPKKVGRYKLSVWIDIGNENKARVSVNGNLKSFNGEIVYVGNWVLLTHYEDLQANQEYTIGIRSASGTLYADDFRLHPIASSMTSYVYNEWDELSYMMGTNGLSTHYIYDDAGRLIETQVEVPDTTPGDGNGGFKTVKKHSYNYKNQ